MTLDPQIVAAVITVIGGPTVAGSLFLGLRKRRAGRLTRAKADDLRFDRIARVSAARLDYVYVLREALAKAGLPIPPMPRNIKPKE